MHQAKRHTHSVAHIKEVKVRPRTEEHDLQVKIGNIKKFLTHGNKAKVTLMFRGREMAHPEFGKEVMNRISEEIQDVGVVENPPKLEGRNMIMLIPPKAKHYFPTGYNLLLFSQSFLLIPCSRVNKN